MFLSFSASTIYISSSASLPFHCQFLSIFASVSEKKSIFFSRLKSSLGFTVNIGSVIWCWSVLYAYVGNLENCQRFSISFQQCVMLPFFPYTSTVSTERTDNPARGGVLPERTMGIALPPSFPVPPSTGNWLASLFLPDTGKNATSLNRHHVRDEEK